LFRSRSFKASSVPSHLPRRPNRRSGEIERDNDHQAGYLSGILLLVEGQISEPCDDGTLCKLSRHFQILTMLENDGYSSFTRMLE
jgi:hypothetical protein